MLIPPYWVRRSRSPELRQDTKNRQNSIDDVDPFVRQEFQIKIKKYFEEGMKLYQQMLDADIAKECARFVLPLTTPTRLYMTGSVRSWIHYIDLRSNGTQKEHMDIANHVRKSSVSSFLLLQKRWGGLNKYYKLN